MSSSPLPSSSTTATEASVKGRLLWYGPGAPQLETKTSKSIIHPFAVKGYQGLAINPYQGCQHRCGYCYATYEWSPEFYDRIYAKSNAPRVLEEQLAGWKQAFIDPVMVASATDAYQPAELKYGLTRKCVQILQKYNVPYYVFTKSAGVIERDLDLYSSYRDNCFIVWSITTCNERKRRVVEPGTPPARRLFETIGRFVDAGASCGVNVDPIMPLITDGEGELDEVVEACREAGVKHVFGAMLRLRADIWERMKAVMKLLEIPGGEAAYRHEIYGFEEPLNVNYVAAKKEYADRVLSRLREKISDCRMAASFPSHMGPRRIERSHLGQTTLAPFLS